MHPSPPEIARLSPEQRRLWAHDFFGTIHRRPLCFRAEPWYSEHAMSPSGHPLRISFAASCLADDYYQRLGDLNIRFVRWQHRKSQEADQLKNEEAIASLLFVIVFALVAMLLP